MTGQILVREKRGQGKRADRIRQRCDQHGDPKTQGWRERDGRANNAPRLEEPGRILAVGLVFFNRLGATGALRVIGRPTDEWLYSHRHHFSLEGLKIKAHRRLEG
jgi:hypothetical protein